MTEEEELKIFPVREIKPQSSRFGGSLIFNPYSDLPPTIWYSVGIDIAEIELGSNAPAPDLWGTKVDTTLILGGILLPQRRWMDISGVFGPIEDVGESSVYISDVHNPIDINSVTFSLIQGAVFRIDFDLLIAFEYEGSGFMDAECSISVEAEYQGLSFNEPVWNDPDSVSFPEKWQIPSEFNEITVSELFERFVDTDSYSIKSDKGYYHFIPKLST